MIDLEAAGADDLDAVDALEVSVDRPLPGALPVGRETVVFCFGSCRHPRRRVTRLVLEVAGARHRPTARRGSRFWASVPLGPFPSPREVEIRVEARLADGTTATARLATIAVVEPSPPEPRATAPAAARNPLIAICMATYNPDAELFRAQVESIRAQTDRDWICLISDDCSDPAGFAAIERIVGGDERFVVSRSDRRLNFHRNFERALRMAPPEAEFVALSDHDDRWYPDKLASLREAIGTAGLAYSDLRRVGADGTVRAETLWDGRRNNRANLASLLVSNTIVGASCLLHRRVVEAALPFPIGPGWDFHDHWLGLVAMAMGDVAYVDRPLYDYVQHPRAVLGRTASRREPRREGPRWRGAPERWKAVYFWLYLQRDLHARVLLARCERQLTAGRRRALQRMVAAQRSPLAFAWLASRPARALLGRTETLGLEAVLARGILWRWLTALRPGRDVTFPKLPPDAASRRQRRWLARQ